MAFIAFRDAGVHTAVLETGLGGRLDATNVVTPELTAITPIDFDHEKFLGTTIEQIAAEKAGILKVGVPAVFTRQRSEAEAVLEARARALDVPVIRTSDVAVERLRTGPRGSTFRLAGHEIDCPLPGDHQVENAVAAALALRQLGIDPSGIARTQWPGRLEWVSSNPDIILDGAHNPAGARALAEYIRRYFRDRRVILIYGTMRDKAVDEIAGTLFPLAEKVIATAPAYSRALRPEAIAEMAQHPSLHVASTVAEALETARHDARPDDAIFVSGSLFIVGEARSILVQ